MMTRRYALGLACIAVAKYSGALLEEKHGWLVEISVLRSLAAELQLGMVFAEVSRLKSYLDLILCGCSAYDSTPIFCSLLT